MKSIEEDVFNCLQTCREDNFLKIIFLVLLLVVALLSLTFPASAVDIANGVKIFNDHCAACHVGGGNILLGEKTLRKEALSKFLENYSIDPIQAIIYQVQHGKNAMPPFKSKLTLEEIIDVAGYVFDKAEQGW